MYIFFKYTPQEFRALPKHVKCSVHILNYMRPHNIYKQIKYLENIPYIEEIIISNGHPEYRVDINNSKIVTLDDFDANEKIGAGRRYAHSIFSCKNEYILFLDDDLIPSNTLIKRMLYEIHNNPMTICGPYKRICDNTGYYTNTKNYNTILTGLAITSKSFISMFINSCFYSKVLPWLIKYKGNCEDLSINLFLRSLNSYPVFVNGKFTKLDTSNGYSSLPQHYDIRNSFCQKYA